MSGDIVTQLLCMIITNCYATMEDGMTGRIEIIIDIQT